MEKVGDGRTNVAVKSGNGMEKQGQSMTFCYTCFIIVITFHIVLLLVVEKAQESSRES